MAWKKVMIPKWEFYYMKEEDSMNDKEKIEERVAVEKYGKCWNELAEFEQDGVKRIWSIHDRGQLEKFLW